METPQLIGGFKQRFDQFVMKYKSLQTENQELKSKIEELNAKIRDREDEIVGLKNANKVNELANAFVNKSVDGHSAKQNISRIVREIDSCIALLNR